MCINRSERSLNTGYYSLLLRGVTGAVQIVGEGKGGRCAMTMKGKNSPSVLKWSLSGSLVSQTSAADHGFSFPQLRLTHSPRMPPPALVSYSASHMSAPGFSQVFPLFSMSSHSFCLSSHLWYLPFLPRLTPSTITPSALPLQTAPLPFPLPEANSLTTCSCPRPIFPVLSSTTTLPPQPTPSPLPMC